MDVVCAGFSLQESEFSASDLLDLVCAKTD